VTSPRRLVLATVTLLEHSPMPMKIVTTVLLTLLFAWMIWNVWR
jgi:hypothetical protein